MFMAFQCFYKRGHKRSNNQCVDVKPQLKSSKSPNNFELNTNWDDVRCPICLEFPHNSVLLQCSSYEKGCRPFVCNTNHLHSNCLERFKTAYGMPPENENPGSVIPESNCNATCPLCRGEVNGWVIIEKARQYLDQKKRDCEEDHCAFIGAYLDLHKHAQEKHPNSRPSKIDPARQLDWENFQQSSEIVDVLSTIHSEVPRGVVLGDYVIEYGNDDDFEDFPGYEGNWWTSCIFYQVFDNLRSTRNRRRSRTSDTRRGNTSNSDDGSVTSIEFADYGDENVDDFVNSRGSARSNSNHRSPRRRRSHFYDH